MRNGMSQLLAIPPRLLMLVLSLFLIFQGPVTVCVSAHAGLQLEGACDADDCHDVAEVHVSSRFLDSQDCSACIDFALGSVEDDRLAATSRIVVPGLTETPVGLAAAFDFDAVAARVPVISGVPEVVDSFGAVACTRTTVLRI